MTLSSVNASETALTVETLFQQLKKSSPKKLTFVEIKTIGFLDVKLEQHGTLEFFPPDTVRRVVNKPDYEMTVIEGDTVTIRREQAPNGKTKTVNINDHPAIRAFVSAFRAPITGDLTTLKQSFSLQLSGDISQWSLVLTPSSYAISSYLSEVIIDGEFDTILTVETIESNDDASYLILTPAD